MLGVRASTGEVAVDLRAVGLPGDLNAKDMRKQQYLQNLLRQMPQFVRKRSRPP